MYGSVLNNGNNLEVLEENNYYPFGMKHEGYNVLAGNPAYKYGYNGKELQTESGMHDYGARFYMADIGRWGVIDNMSEKYRRHSPYNYAINNPIKFTDPDGNDPLYGEEAQAFFRQLQNSMSSKPKDDITIKNDGTVLKKVVNGKPNRFFDESGKQLFFNDPQGVNKSFLSRKFNEGDRIYYPVSMDETVGAVNDVKSNNSIRFLRKIGAFGAANALIAKESMWGNGDFSGHFLSSVIGEENGDHVYENDSFYNIRFGKTNTIFSLMDAGNAMWGLWTFSLGLPNVEVKASSHLYELIINQSYDTPADQRAIFFFRNLLKSK
ncbi:MULTISPECIES: RHS repeat-associated core domain-containing protein [Chryseobacterium]|uniref:RHS repeat-associated core domain-containing protein n=1 Tax=Chryseobacterium endophyticum TaxID=1854762 RepID=A0AAU6WS07_9FLAO